MEVESEFQKQPWYQKTDRKAPVARDCPELEAMIAGVENEYLFLKTSA